MGTKNMNIRQLVDVAIGNPEPGVVNFNALYTVLLAICEKLELQNENIEVDSSYCPCSTNTIVDSRSNISSEKLMDQQMLDCVTEVIESCFKSTDGPDTETNECLLTGGEPSGECKVTEDRDAYLLELRQYIDALNAKLCRFENNLVASAGAEMCVKCLHQRISLLEEKLLAVQQTVDELNQRSRRHTQEIDLGSVKQTEPDNLGNMTDEIKLEIAELKKTVSNSFTDQSIKEQQSSATTHALRDLIDHFSKLQNQLHAVRYNMSELEDKFLNMERYLTRYKNSDSPVSIQNYQNELSLLNNQIETVCSQFDCLQKHYETQTSSLEEIKQVLEDMVKSKEGEEEKDDIKPQRKEQIVHINLDNDGRDLMETQIDRTRQSIFSSEDQFQKKIDDTKRSGDQELLDMIHSFKRTVENEIQLLRNDVRKLTSMKPNASEAPAPEPARLSGMTSISDNGAVNQDEVLNSPKSSGKDFAGAAEGKILFGYSGCRHTGGEHTIVTNRDRVWKTRGTRPNK